MRRFSVVLAALSVIGLCTATAAAQKKKDGDADDGTVFDNTEKKKPEKKDDSVFDNRDADKPPPLEFENAPTYATTDPDPVGARRSRFRPGVGLGLRLHWMQPFGEAEKGADLSRGVVGGIGIAPDIGYRINPNLFVGLTLGAAYILSEECAAGFSCSGWDFRAGPLGIWRFTPFENIVPWAGLGFGYEYFVVKAAAAQDSISNAYHGFQFAEVLLGADFLTSRNYAGPYVGMQIGQFSKRITTVKGDPFGGGLVAEGTESASVAEPATHFWLVLGLHASLD